MQARLSGTRPLNPRLLLAFEGTNTEPQYFEKLKRHLGLLHSVKVHKRRSIGENSPTQIVNSIASQILEQGKITDAGFNEAYCIFDRDEWNDFDTAFQLADDHNKRFGKAGYCEIQCIPSYPCFEVWLIFHFEFDRSPIAGTRKRTAGDVAKSRLLSFFVDQNRAQAGRAFTELQLEELMEKLDVALRNATAANLDADDTNERNPSTDVDRLVTRLIELSRLNDG